MTKSETSAARNEQQPTGEKLAAPISLTPEQLEGVAAGLMASPSGGGRGATTGFAPRIKLY
jgi:hypothetical protein